MKRFGWLFVLSMLILPLSGCGYRMAGVEGLYDQDIETVAVPMFRNQTFYRYDEVQLTDALVRQIQKRTPYRIASRGSADTVLEGTIVDIERITLSRDSDTALPNQQVYIMRVDWVWRDLRTGRVLAEEEDFEQVVNYFPTLGEGQFVASQEAAEELAAAMVESMAGAW